MSEEIFHLEFLHSRGAENVIQAHTKHLLDSESFSDLEIYLPNAGAMFKVHKAHFSIVCPNLDLSQFNVIQTNVSNISDINHLLDLVYLGRTTAVQADEVVRLKQLMVSLGCWDTFLPHFKDLPKFLSDSDGVKYEENISFEFKTAKEEVGERQDSLAQAESFNQDIDIETTKQEAPEDFFKNEDEIEETEFDISNLLENPDGNDDSKPKKKKGRPKKVKVKKESKESEDSHKQESKSKKKQMWKAFNLEYHVIDGERVHKEKVGIGCPLCDHVWKGLCHSTKHRSMPRHFKKAHPSTPKSMLEEILQTVPRNVNYIGPEGHPLLRRYREKKLPISEYKFFCPNCEEKCATFNDLKEHVLLIHNGEKIEKLNNIDMRPYKCEHCDSSYTNHYNLLHHQEGHTQGKQTCDICAASFMNKILLKSHMSKVHEKVGKVDCPICGKSQFKNNLQGHLNSHNGIRAFKCEYCGNGFFSKDQLMTHVRVQHLDQRNYECETCKKRFATLSKMRDHVDAMHLNIKRHGCHWCDQRFSCSSNRRKHAIKAHPDEFQKQAEEKEIKRVC